MPSNYNLRRTIRTSLRARESIPTLHTITDRRGRPSRRTTIRLVNRAIPENAGQQQENAQPARRRIRISLVGYWTPENLERRRQEFVRARSRLEAMRADDYRRALHAQQLPRARGDSEDRQAARHALKAIRAENYRRALRIQQYLRAQQAAAANAAAHRSAAVGSYVKQEDEGNIDIMVEDADEEDDIKVKEEDESHLSDGIR
ncbi:hypothetical protein BJ170DRAFT_606656 [Xylariales sp. AK1849]|nr:hypothetical protein BJ170DRAFT_606656 [Xylariales sp. AK1849]